MKVSIDMSKAEELGKRRTRFHKDVGNSAPKYHDDENLADIIGAAGEIAFGKLFGSQVDETDREYGDNGIDHTIELAFTVDVKTYLKPYNLLLKEDAVDNPVDILVLGKYCGSGIVEFLGWQWKSIMVKQPKKDFGIGTPSHYMPAEELRSMDELIDRSPRG